MIRAKAAKRLTKKEQQHLTEMGINSIAAMKRQVDDIKRARTEHPDTWTFRCCLDCARIGRKFGML